MEDNDMGTIGYNEPSGHVDARDGIETSSADVGKAFEDALGIATKAVETAGKTATVAIGIAKAAQGAQPQTPPMQRPREETSSGSGIPWWGWALGLYFVSKTMGRK